jgi:tetratricopeptide (TPR) repeat protein
LIGQKRPLKPKDVWAIRVRLQLQGRKRDLALFNLAIDSKLRGCDLVCLQVDDVCVGGRVRDRGTVIQAMTQLDEALQIVERTGERWFEAELTRQKGQLLLRQGQSEAVEELYRKALSIAREQEAKLWELRAAVSFARLRRDQGRRAEAHDLLAPVYGWFTEGFDTLDLKEAKALLDELRSGRL